MRILLLNFILHTAEKGVITRRETNRYTMIYSMARGFMKEGHEVTLLASSEYKPLKEEDPGFEVIFFDSRMPSVFRPDVFPFPKGLASWLRRNSGNYDLAVTSETFMMPSLLASLFCSCQLLIWQELETFQKMMHGIPAAIWHKAIAPLFMRKTEVVARSAAARGFISRYMPRVSKEIVEHGADADIFYPGDETEDSFVVLSQLVKRKRIDRILRNFARFVAIPEYSSFTLNIIGDGPERETLESLVRGLGIEKNVVFHGFLFHLDAAPISRRAKALLIDTAQDLNMVSVPESIANGTPVIMNTIPNTASFIAEKRLGIAADDWNESHLVQMVERYDEFHKNCKRVRDTLTNVGSARKILDIAGFS